jgi:hypothetical protein
MQLLGSLVVSTHEPPQLVGAFGGQLATHAKPPSTVAHVGAVAPHAFPQRPQLEAVVPSTHPPLHVMKPAGQPLPSVPFPPSESARASPASPGRAVSAGSVASVSKSASLVASVSSADNEELESTAASQSPGQSPVLYASSPEIAAHAASAPASATAPTIAAYDPTVTLLLWPGSAGNILVIGDPLRARVEPCRS